MNDELQRELERWRADAAGAAALRLAFNKAAETFPASSPMSKDMQAWWGALYDAIVGTGAGMGLLAELARLREVEKNFLLLREWQAETVS